MLVYCASGSALCASGAYIAMDEPSWKKFKLSLERPYKNDNGEYLPVLLDITTQGEHIYEPYVIMLLTLQQLVESI